MNFPARLKLALEQQRAASADPSIIGSIAGTHVPIPAVAPVLDFSLDLSDAPTTLEQATQRHIATSGFMHDREAPAEWTRRLREISPISEQCGWLELVWEPGDPWVPGQRWTLCEMIHEQFLEPVVLRELRGPHPRSEGHMCSTNVPSQFQCLCRRKMESWKGGTCHLITLTQWKTFQRTGYFANSFWVIQGNAGGHKREFAELEAQFLRQAGLLSEAPRIADLPYADFDERTVKQIVRYNRLENMGMQLDEYKRTMAGGYEQYKQTLASNLRREWLKHLEDQMAEPTELFLRATGDMENRRRTSVDYDRLDEQSTDHYIQTGRVLHHTEMK